LYDRRRFWSLFRRTRSPDTPVVRRSYLVAYDVTDDKRRARVFTALRGFGDHIQFSVFECQMDASELARCRHVLGTHIHHRDDQVLFVDLGPAESRGDRVITALGRAYSVIDSPCLIADGLPLRTRHVE
jgi:CRISPR-associated protein Cas2